MDVLVTGGAGFIGSHLADALVESGARVRILDNFSTGLRANLHDAVDLVDGSITDADTVRAAVSGCDVVYHLAARGAVARSLADPVASDDANVHGTLEVLTAARDAGVRRVVFASSSSVYGGLAPIPTSEDAPLRPRSPYAVSKLAAEWYTRVFAELFGLETVALRFFNVFGPRQRPDSIYAAVVPLFATALLEGRMPTVHGDGTQSRDFTYVADVVACVIAAAHAPNERCNGNVYNVAPGRRRTLLDLLAVLRDLTGSDLQAVHGPPRPGDVPQSEGDGRAARRDLGWEPRWTFEAGLAETVAWLRAHDRS